MDFDWSTVTFDYNAEENNFAVFEPSTQENNPLDTIQQSSYQYNTDIIAEITFEQEIELYEQPINHVIDQQQIIIEQPTMIIEQPTKRTRQEMEQSYIIEVPAIINEINEEIEDNEDVKSIQQPEQLDCTFETSNQIYYCTTCSLDFASIAYYKRHQNTKIHLKALQMEQKGKKFNQQRQYVRRNALKQESTVNNNTLQRINDLTEDDINIIQMFSDNIPNNTENTAKNFYENFLMNLCDENEHPPSKIQKLSSVEEIMTDLIESSEQFSIQHQPLTTIENIEDFIVQQPKRKYRKNQQPKLNEQQTEELKKILIEDNQKLKVQCQKCPRKFSRESYLKQHMNVAHSENMNFKCQKCGKKFATQELLDQHMQKHSTDKPFQCPLCERCYSNKIDMKRHLKTHDDVQKFYCKICGGGFNRSDHLQQHMLVHQRQMENKIPGKTRGRKLKINKN